MAKEIDLGAVTAYATAVEHGYEGTEEQFAAQMTGAAQAAIQAAQDASDAEAYAIGKRDGVDVPSTDPAYQNNAKYWAQNSSGANLGNAFNTNTAYSAGDYAINLGKLWRFTTAHPAGAWTGTDAAEVKAMDEVRDLKDDLKQGQTSHVKCESGTFDDSTGKKKSPQDNKRIRNIHPIPIRNCISITIPLGYEAWPFLYDDELVHIRPHGSWVKNRVVISDIATNATEFINIAIRKTDAQNDDISSYIDFISNGIILTYSCDVVSCVSAFADELDDKINNITDDLCSLDTFSDYTPNLGKRWEADGSLVDNSSSNAYEINIIGGETYYLSGQNIHANATYAIRFLLHDGSVFSRTDYNGWGVFTDIKVKTPIEAVKLLITAGISYAFSVKIKNVEYTPKEYTDSINEIATRRFERIEDYMYQYKDITDEYDIPNGQAYGTVEHPIQFSSSTEYKHVRISKSDEVYKVKFSTVYENTNISSYIQYVDDDDVIIDLQYTKGNYTPGETYEYVLEYPDGATGVYITGGRLTSGGAKILIVYANEEINIDSIKKEINTKADEDYNDIVMSICRIADDLSVPQQSIIGYKTAYKNGFRVMLCDLQFTSDNVPVLWHDLYLNQFSNTVYDSNGNLVSTSNPIYINQTSFADLQEYDFGLYKGSEFGGTKILTLEAMLNLCKQLGCYIFIEQKQVPTTQQYDVAFSLIYQYGMGEKCVWNPQTLAELSTLTTYESNVNICLHTNLGSSALTDAMVNAIVSAKNDYNKDKLWLLINTQATMTESQMITLAKNGIKLAVGTPSTEQQLLDYYAKGKPYTAVKAVLSNTLIAGKILLDNVAS